jgi:hypothetical protein
MPQSVILPEPANDFHRLHLRLQQTFLLSKLFEVFGRFAVFALMLSMYA